MALPVCLRPPMARDGEINMKGNDFCCTLSPSQPSRGVGDGTACPTWTLWLTSSAETLAPNTSQLSKARKLDLGCAWILPRCRSSPWAVLESVLGCDARQRLREQRSSAVSCCFGDELGAWFKSKLGWSTVPIAQVRHKQCCGGYFQPCL